MMKEKQKTNRVLTIVLILGTVTVFFPLYITLNQLILCGPVRTFIPLCLVGFLIIKNEELS